RKAATRIGCAAMKPSETTQADDSFVSLLVACDEALAAGIDATVLAHVTPADFEPRLERGVACLGLLAKLWHAPGPAGRFPALAATAAALPVSLGRFRIRRELGRGGFGIVFLAYDPWLDRDVALKVQQGGVLVTAEQRQRFQLEAQATARLDHPNLVPVYEAGEVDHVCYLATAYCPGLTLAQWLKDRAEPVPAAEAAALVASLADAVHHAHSRGVLHRDLKPANILLASKSEIPNPKSETNLKN